MRTLTPWICLGVDTRASTKGRSIAQPRLSKTKPERSRPLYWSTWTKQSWTVVGCCLPQQTSTVVILLCMTVQHAQLATARRCCLLPPATAVVRLQCRICMLNMQLQGDTVSLIRPMLWSDCTAWVRRRYFPQQTNVSHLFPLSLNCRLVFLDFICFIQYWFTCFFLFIYILLFACCCMYFCLVYCNLSAFV